MAIAGLVVSTIALIIGSIFSFLLYILTAFGLYRLSKNYGLDHAWIAWIPICQWYLIGELIGDKIFGLDYAKWILTLFPIAAMIISFFVDSGFVTGLLNLCSYILTAAAYYKLFKIYKPQSAVLYLITGLIISPLLGLYTFLIRNNPRHQLVQ